VGCAWAAAAVSASAARVIRASLIVTPCGKAEILPAHLAERDEHTGFVHQGFHGAAGRGANQAASLKRFR
jgi:hypothetical protein